MGGGVLNAAMHNPVALPCTGDWVVLRTGRTTNHDRGGAATADRGHAGGAGRAAVGQVLAANLDTAAVVEPVDPQPDFGRIERLLALAWESGATRSWC